MFYQTRSTVRFSALVLRHSRLLCVTAIKMSGLCDPSWRNIDATASHTNPHRRMSVLCASQCIATLTLIIAPSTQLLPHTDRHRPILTEYWRNSDRYESWMWHLCSKMFENARRVLRQPKIYWPTLTDTDAAQVKCGHYGKLFANCLALYALCPEVCTVC